MREKDRLIRDIGIELRRPLTTILGTLELLGQREVPEWLGNQIRTLQYAARDLTLTADNLLSYTELLDTLERGTTVEFSLEKKINAFANDFKAEAERFGLKHHCNIQLGSEVAGQKYRGNPFTLSRIVDAILRSCLQISHKTAHIEFQAAVDVISAEEQFLLINISSTQLKQNANDSMRFLHIASSLDQTLELRIADPYFQFELACRLTQILGGTLSVELGEDESEFALQVELPLHPVDGGTARVRVAEAQAHESASTRNALLVEDDRGNSAVLAQLLRNLGYEVTTADDGLKAVEMFTEKPFEIVLMDCGLPGIDGLRASALIRDLESSLSSRCTIIAMTANHQEERRVRKSGEEIDDFLLKPISLEDLSASIADCAPSRGLLE